MKKKILVAIIGIGIIVTAFIYISIYLSNEEVAVQPAQEVDDAQVAVYVSGAVKTPAVVKFNAREDFRLVDAVNAAGGMTELADAEMVNLAEKIHDGQHIHIPTKDIHFREIAASSDEKNSSSSDLININTADEKELQKIKGIGPALAGRIIEYRESHGAFKSIDEIKKVRGIGDKTFEKMRDQIKV